MIARPYFVLAIVAAVIGVAICFGSEWDAVLWGLIAAVVGLAVAYATQ